MGAAQHSKNPTGPEYDFGKTGAGVRWAIYADGIA